MKKLISLLAILAMLTAILPLGASGYIGNDGTGVDYAFESSNTAVEVPILTTQDAVDAFGAGWSVVGNPVAAPPATITAQNGYIWLDNTKFGGEKALRIERIDDANRWGEIGLKRDFPLLTTTDGNKIIVEGNITPEWPSSGVSNGGCVYYFDVYNGNTFVFRIFVSGGRIFSYQTTSNSNSQATMTDKELSKPGREYTIKMYIDTANNGVELEITTPLAAASTGVTANDGFALTYENGIEKLATTRPIPLSGGHTGITSVRLMNGGYTGTVYFKDVKVGKLVDLPQEKVFHYENFATNDKYVVGQTQAQGNIPLPAGWNLYDGEGGISINTAIVGSSTQIAKSLLIGPIEGSQNGDNPYLEIPVESQHELLQVEYNMYAPGGGSQPFFEAYGEGQKRIRVAGPSRQITVVQNLTNDSDFTKNILFWNAGKDLRFGSSAITTFKYIIDIPNKKYDLYITNSRVGEAGILAEMNKPRVERIGETNTVVCRDIPLLGSSNVIDKLKFGGVAPSNTDIFSFSVQTLRVATMEKVTGVTTDTNTDVTDGGNILNTTEYIDIAFSDSVQADSLAATANTAGITLESGLVEVPCMGQYDSANKSYRLTPMSPLTAGVEYTIKFDGVKDINWSDVYTENITFTAVPDFAVSALTFTDGDTPAAITEFDSGTDLKVTVTVSNNNSGSKQAILFLAIYDNNTKLYAIGASAPATITGGASADLSVSGLDSIPDAGLGYTARAFVWESSSTMTPVKFAGALAENSVISGKNYIEGVGFNPAAYTPNQLVAAENLNEKSGVHPRLYYTEEGFGDLQKKS